MEIPSKVRSYWSANLQNLKPLKYSSYSFNLFNQLKANYWSYYKTTTFDVKAVAGIYFQEKRWPSLASKSL